MGSGSGRTVGRQPEGTGFKSIASRDVHGAIVQRFRDMRKLIK